MLLLGTPVQNATYLRMLNETELDQCREGKATQFAWYTPGKHCFRLTDPKNFHLQGRVHPAPVQRAMRWQRKALLATDEEDRFLFLYTAMESLSRAIKQGDELTSTCAKCGDVRSYKPSSDHAGIKQLISEMCEESARTPLYQELNRIRAKIVHGNVDPRQYYPELMHYTGALQALVLRGLGKVLGADTPIRIVDPKDVMLMSLARATYGKQPDPSASWGEPLPKLGERMWRTRPNAAPDSTPPTSIS